VYAKKKKKKQCTVTEVKVNGFLYVWKIKKKRKGKILKTCHSEKKKCELLFVTIWLRVS
jgi:hypothetical protein